MITVEQFLGLFEETIFKSYYLIDDPKKIKKGEELEEAQEVREFKLTGFGKWYYGISNSGRSKGSFVFIVQKEIDGKIFTNKDAYDTLEDVKSNEKLMKMEVIKIQEFSLEGHHVVSSTGGAWPANHSSIVFVVR